MCPTLYRRSVAGGFPPPVPNIFSYSKIPRTYCLLHVLSALLTTGAGFGCVIVTAYGTFHGTSPYRPHRLWTFTVAFATLHAFLYLSNPNTAPRPGPDQSPPSPGAGRSMSRTTSNSENWMAVYGNTASMRGPVPLHSASTPSPAAARATCAMLPPNAMPSPCVMRRVVMTSKGLVRAAPAAPATPPARNKDVPDGSPACRVAN